MRLANLALGAALLLTGCWDVLTAEQTETVWMEWDGSVEITPAALELAAEAGQQTTADLTLSETSGRAGIELQLVLQGDGASSLTIHPGEWSVGLTPTGTLTVQVTFTAPSEAGTQQAELVATTTGSPAEVRIPITLTITSP